MGLGIFRRHLIHFAEVDPLVNSVERYLHYSFKQAKWQVSPISVLLKNEYMDQNQKKLLEKYVGE